MGFRLLSAEAFYTEEQRFWERVDPASQRDQSWRDALPATGAQLTGVLGDPAGRAVLDASCGTGTQALALAQLGWRVTGTDLAVAALEVARQRATQLGLTIDFRRCDMRELGHHFRARFDAVITCGALDNITEDGGIPQALAGMYRALRPGGTWYLWLRDMEWHLARERYRYKGTRPVPHGQVITVEDWLVEGETHVVHVYAHLHEDPRRVSPEETWRTEALAYRRRRLRKADLARFLEQTGFRDVTFLPQPHPWDGYQVVARTPGP